MMEFKDYYQTLGVAKTATEKEIKQAFRKLARKHHPDVNPGDKTAEARSRRSTRRTRCSATPTSGRKYDELGANWRMYEQAQQQGQGFPGGSVGFGGGAQDAWTINMGGPGGGYRTMTQEEMQELFGNEDPFSDFFRRSSAAAAGATGRPGARRPRAADAEGPATSSRRSSSTLEEAYHGATRRISIKQGGHARNVDVRIPAGVKEARACAPPAKASREPTAAPSGDLYLRVQHRAAPGVRAQGQRPAYARSRAGDDGRARRRSRRCRRSPAAVRLKIPEATQNGQVFRLKGHGMPDGRQAGRTRRSLCHRRRPAAPRADAGAAAALRGAAEAGRPD